MEAVTRTRVPCSARGAHTFAGRPGEKGHADGDALGEARFNQCCALAIDESDGSLLVGDWSSVRRIRDACEVGGAPLVKKAVRS